jgi:hypothetical protein
MRRVPDKLGRVVAAALLASIAGATSAGAVDVFGSSAGLSWSAASGPVSGYAVQVSRNGSAYREEQRVAGLTTRVSGAVDDTLRVRIAAHDPTGRVGPAGTPSDPLVFKAAASPPPPPPPPPMPGPGGNMAGDLNGDGLSDSLVYSSATGELGALLLQSNGTRVWQPIGMPSDRNLRAIGSADVDGDGQADVLWRNNQSGANEVWLMTGTGYGVLALPSQPVDWSSAAFRDFDGDDRADVLWYQGTTGASVLWTLDGTGRTSETPLDPAPAGMRLAAVADIDGDGAPDLVWYDAASRAVEAWQMDAAVPLAVFGLPNAPSGARPAGAADFDGDGSEDLVWRSKSTVRVWFMDGMQAPASGIAITLSSKRKLRGAVDVDSNGRADLVTSSKSGFTAFAISPTGTANAAGEMQWSYQAIALDALPQSKTPWSFLVLQ